MEHQAILFALISGICLIVIQVRKKPSLFASILSQKMTVNLDKTDKKLALIALISFLYCVVALFKSLWFKIDIKLRSNGNRLVYEIIEEEIYKRLS